MAFSLNGDITTAPTNVVAPNRINTATLAVRGTSTSYLSIADITTAEVQRPYTAYVFVNRVDSQFACIRVGESLTTNYAEACFDLTNGTTSRVNVTGSIINPDSFIHAVGDSWFVIGLTLTFETSVGIDFFLTATDDIESTVTSESTTSLSLNFFNPILERRDNVEMSYLGSPTEISVPEGEATIVPIFQPNTTSVEYLDRSGNTVTISVDPSQDFNTASAVTYFSIPQRTSHGFPSSFTINDNAGGSQVININRENVFNRYSTAKVVFLNKEGSLDTLWMIRKRVFAQDTKHDMYYRNVVDYNNFEYNQFAHVNQKYNVVSKESIDLNTALIPESQNRVIRELMQSEYVWVTVDGNTFPVIMVDNSIPFKTHNNDKLVQYAFTFEYAHRLDNTIR